MMKSKKVMIVEDDLISAEYLKELCQSHQFDVCCNEDNAKIALEKFKTLHPDIILMDIMIKGPLSGVELALQIRTFNQEVIIIFLTAYTSEEILDYALDTKAYSFLLKPYRDIEIMTTMKMAIKENSNQDKKNGIFRCKNGFVFKDEEKKFYYYHEEIILSNKLLLLVEVLIKKRGEPVSHTQIHYALWGEERSINTLRAIVHRLKVQLPKLELHPTSMGGYILY